MQNKPKKLCFLRRWLFKGKSQHQKEKICRRLAIAGAVLYSVLVGVDFCCVNAADKAREAAAQEQKAQQAQAAELPAVELNADAEQLSR